MEDEEKNALDEAIADALVSEAVSWPPYLYAYVKFGYENTLKAELDAEGKSFGDWVDEIMTHVQTYYNHDSMPTKIQFKVFKLTQKL